MIYLDTTDSFLSSNHILKGLNCKLNSSHKQSILFIQFKYCC